MADGVEYITSSAVADKNLEDDASETTATKQENVEGNTCLHSASPDSEKGAKVKSNLCRICSQCFTSNTLLEEHLKIHAENDDHGTLSDISTGPNEQPHAAENEGHSFELSDSGENFPTLWSRRSRLQDGAPFATFPEHFKSKVDLHPKQVYLPITGKQSSHESSSVTLPHPTCSYSQRDTPISRPMLGALFYPQAFNTLHNLRLNKQVVGSNEMPFTCDLCNETFALPSQLFTHRASHNADVPRSAVHNKPFQTIQSLDVREQTEHSDDRSLQPVSLEENMSSSHPKRKWCSKRNDHLVGSPSKSKLYVCSYCKKTFSCNSHRVEHERIHTNKKPFSCSMCGKAFAHRGNLKSHIKTHTGEKDTPQCAKCRATFKSRYLLTKHRKLHREHICRICKNRFPTEDFLKRHLKYHGRVAYVCDVCNKNCSTYAELDKHCGTHNKSEHGCNKCGKLFKTLSQYDKHKCSRQAANHHRCRYCHKRFTQTKDLSLHLRVHTQTKTKPSGGESVQLSKKWDSAEKKYPCRICSGCFESYYRLMRHRQLHKTRPFMCKICEETFISDSDLRTHISSGCGDSALHVCSQCPKTFKTESALKRHKIKHALETPYSCTVCSQHFKTASHLTEHLLVHQKPYVCKTCDKRFVKRRTLQQHMRTQACSKPSGSDRITDTFQTASKPEIPHFQGQISDLPSPQVMIQETPQVHHAVSSSVSLMCNSCGLTFRSLSEMQLHMQVHVRPGIHKEAPVNTDIQPHMSFQQEGNMFQYQDNGLGESHTMSNVIPGLQLPPLDPSVSVHQASMPASQLPSSLLGPQTHGSLYPSQSPFSSTTDHLEFHMPDPIAPPRPEAEDTSTSSIFHEALDTLYAMPYQPQLTPDPSDISTGSKIYERSESGIFETDIQITCPEKVSHVDTNKQVDLSDGNELTSGTGGFDESIQVLGSKVSPSVEDASDSSESTVGYSDYDIDDDFPPDNSMPLEADEPEEDRNSVKSQKQLWSDSEPHSNESCKDVTGSSFTDESIIDGSQGLNNMREVRLVLKKIEMYTCSICEKAFDMKAKLNRHMVCHSNLRPFQCKLCDSAFKHRWHLGDHEIRFHGKTRQQLKMETIERRMNSFLCGFCNKNFEQRFLLKQHQLTCTMITDVSAKKGRKEIHRCAVCSIKFSKEALQKHIKSHSEATQRKFNLNVSNEQEQGSVVKTADNIPKISECKEVQSCRREDSPGSNQSTCSSKKGRKATKKDNERFKCQVCLKSFSASFSFKNHISQHSDEKRHVCRMCGQCYKHKIQLDIHVCPAVNPNTNIRFSTIKQMFKCSQCPQYFLSYCLRLAHERDEHNTILLQCSDCDCTFSGKISYWVHLCQIHNSTSKEAWACAASQYESRLARNQHTNITSEEQIPFKNAKHFSNQLKDDSSACPASDKVLDNPKELEEHTLNCTKISARPGCAQGSQHGPPMVDARAGQASGETELSETDQSPPQSDLDHPKDGSFNCHTCNKSFTSKGALSRHAVTHSDERIFICDDCGCSYKRKPSLVYHMKVCTGRCEQTKIATPTGKRRDSSTVSHPPSGKIRFRPSSVQGGHGAKTDDSQDQSTTVRSTNNDSNAAGNLGEPWGLNNVAQPAVQELAPGDDSSNEIDAKTSVTTESSANLKDLSQAQHNEASTSQEKSAKKAKLCRTCEKEFNKYSVLISHLIEDHNRTWSNLFPCDYCNASFPNPVRLAKHEIKHTVGWKCRVCGKGFPGKNNLSDHMKSHSSKLKFVCDICGKTFQRMWILRAHQAMHSDDCSFPCIQCQETFKSKPALNSHRRLMHSVKTKDVMCEKCGKQFRTIKDLRYHAIRVHPATPWLDENNKPITCNLCGKPFRDTMRLACHIRRGSCTKKEEFTCQTCGKSFRKKAFLVMHSHSHQEKRTKCNYCNKVFCRRYLYIHERGHTNTRLYTCKYCPKKFFTKNVADDHQNIHTGEKPHKCQTCGAAFNSRGTLNHHYRVHRKDKKQNKKQGNSSKRKAGGTKGMK